MRSGFGGLYELLQYAPPDVHDTKINILKTIYDEIDGTLKECKLDHVIMYQSYLQNCYQTVLTNIVCNEEPLLEVSISELISTQIIDCFKWRQDVNEEAFIVISSLSNMYK